MKEESRREHNPVSVSSEEAFGKAEQLAPLEERTKKAANQKANDEGGLTVDTGDLKIPKDFTEKREEKSGLFDLEPITILIFIFAIAFIAVMAYLIATEPAKTKEEPHPVVEQKS